MNGTIGMEIKGDNMNRKQRRQLMNKRSRGVGFTRQHTSSRAIDKFGRKVKTKSPMMSLTPEDWASLMALQSEMAAASEAEDLTTEEIVESEEEK